MHPRDAARATMSLFHDFEPDSLRALFALRPPRWLEPGEVLFRQGDAGSSAYLVDWGTVEVVGESPDGPQVLARLGEGSFFGEVAFLSPGPRTATVRSAQPSRVAVLERGDFDERIAQGDPIALRLSHQMAMVLASRLRSTSRLVQETLLGDDDTPDTAAPVDVAALAASTGLPVRVASEIQQQDLLDLVEGRVLAVRVPGYYPRRTCEQLCRRLLRHPGFARYLLAPDVGVQRIGMTLFETQGKPELVDRYFGEARTTMRSIRHLCAPLQTPLDRLRLELDEAWPAGATVERLGGQTMLAGIARLFEDDHSLPPHQDLLQRDLPGLAADQRLQAQLTANVYLRLAKSGGELELWDWMPTEAEAKGLLTGEYDFYDRDKLPEPNAAIRPLQGELVLTLSSRIHAVRPSVAGPRISLSVFVGYRGPGAPLALWS